MRNSAVIILSGIVLLTQALLAHAEGGGPVTPPAVGTSNPAPPAAGSDIGAPLPQKPALKGNNALGTNGTAVDQAGGPVATDTSTAAPGGQAESSRNGALSSPPDAASPPDGNPIHPNHDRQQPANEAGEETPK